MTDMLAAGKSLDGDYSSTLQASISIRWDLGCCTEQAKRVLKPHAGVVYFLLSGVLTQV